MSRVTSLVAALALLGCEPGQLLHEPVPLPECMTAWGLCAPPQGFIRRNAEELWGVSPDIVAIRKDGRWEWRFLCIEGEQHSLIGFRGDEVWLLCDGEVRRSRYPEPAVKVDTGPGAVGAFINLEDDFLLIKADGIYGWDGSAFQRVAALPPDATPEGGLFGFGFGVSRTSFTYADRYWNGSEWSAWSPETSERPVPGRGASKRVGGFACHDGRYRMEDGVAYDIVEGLRRGPGSVSFLESADCRTALFVTSGGVSRASADADPVLLGGIRAFDQPIGDPGVGRAYQLDQRRLLYVAPHNLPGVDIGFWEVHLP